MKIVSIDFQKDFTSPDGKCFCPRPSVDFVKSKLTPFLKREGVKIAEILSDYREPSNDKGNACVPGTNGFVSEIPDDVKNIDRWIKAMNSPIWTRKNAGVPGSETEMPYQDPKGFDNWLSKVVGDPKDSGKIVLIGLTLDCCVLCTAEELDFRGYDVKILEEATDVYSGDQKEKEYLINHLPVQNWAKAITWNEFRSKL